MPRAQVAAHPLRPRQGAALPDREVVDVRDRLLVVLGPGEHGREEVGAGEDRRWVVVGVGTGPGGEDRVERRHPSTVTPSADERRRRIPLV